MSAKKWTPEVIVYLAELAKTNSYIELAEIYKIKPSRMHKILSRNKIKSVSTINKNPLIDSRPVRGKQRELEFRVLGKTESGGIVRNGWFTYNQITAWDECDCTVYGLKYRFTLVGSKYKDIYEAITDPVRVRTNTNPRLQKINREFIDSNNYDVNLWPIGSMYKKAKIMQSVRY